MRFALLATRLALAALLLAAIIAAVAVLSVRTGLANFSAGLETMAASVTLAAIALMLALVWLAAALRHNRGDGKRAGMAALLGSLLLLYVPLHSVYEGLLAPPIHDATTNPEDPPRFVALAKRPPGANSTVFDAAALIDYRGEHNTVSYMLHEYYANLTKPLQPIMVTGKPTGKMFWRCFNTAKKLGWRIVDYNEAEGRIEATATSFWFAQVSDIVIRVRSAGTLGARFDMRAESETGARDFGHNLELMKTYRAALNS
jgi:hypothetical protein